MTRADLKEKLERMVQKLTAAGKPDQIVTENESYGLSCLSRQCASEEKEAKRKLRKPKKVKPPYPASDKVKEWFKEYCRGWADSYKWRIVWVSPDERFVLVHQPGGMYASGMDYLYAKASRSLVDLSKTSHGIMERQGVEVESWEGRCNKAMMEKVHLAVDKCETIFKE